MVPLFSILIRVTSRRTFSASAKSRFFVVLLSLTSEVVNIPDLIQFLLRLGSYDLKVIVSRNPENPRNYGLGLECNAVSSEELSASIRSHFPSEQLLDMEVYPRKGFNAICAELRKEEMLFLWGVSLPEIQARAHASRTKVNLDYATSLTLKGGAPFYNKEYVSIGLEHLYIWVRNHYYPSPYKDGEINDARREVLRWLGDNLVLPRAIGGFQFLILGYPGVQKSVFVELISKSLRVYFPPLSLDNFEGAEQDWDLWVLDGISPHLWDEEWLRSAAASKLERILSGQTVALEWGVDSRHVFLKRANLPIILISNGGAIPPALMDPFFSNKLVFTRWSDFVRSDMTPERIAATIFSRALLLHLVVRREVRPGIVVVPTYVRDLGTSLEYEGKYSPGHPALTFYRDTGLYPIRYITKLFYPTFRIDIFERKPSDKPRVGVSPTISPPLLSYFLINLRKEISFVPSPSKEATEEKGGWRWIKTWSKEHGKWRLKFSKVWDPSLVIKGRVGGKKISKGKNKKISKGKN